MKFSCVFVLCLLGVLSTASAFQSCTASGDPHVKTFDGVYHDLQGNGTFQMVQNKLFNVQARYLNCTATSLVTCIYSITVQYAPLGSDGDSFVVSWGAWPGEAAQLAKFQYNYAGSTAGTTVSVPLSGLTALVNTVDANGVYTYPLFDPKNVVSRRPLPSFYVLVSPGNVLKLGSNTAGLNVGETSVLVQPQVIFSLRSLTVLIPDDTNRFATPVQTVTDYSSILTNGLCGRFDYAGTNDFTNNGALTSTFITAKNLRYNSPAYPVNAWGASFAVSTDPTAIPPLLSGNVYDMNGNIHLQSTMEIQATVPTVPTDAQQATLNVVTFENGVSQMAAATTFCNQQAAGKTYDSVIIENCVYDAAFVGDLSTAASNGQTYEVAAAASNTAIASSSGSSSSNDTAVIVGVTIGCVAAVAIIVGIVLYFRLQRVKEDYSRALILRNQSTAGGPNTAGSSADIEFHHADNL